MPNRSPVIFGTNIFFASTVKTLTTARKKLNDLCSRADGCTFAGPSVVGGSCHYCVLFCPRPGDWTVLEGARQHRRGLLHGRTRDDSLGGGPGILVRKPRITGTHGLGGQRL